MTTQGSVLREPAAALYVGKVMHARLKPVGHRFTYKVVSLLIDLDRLSEADAQSPLFGVNRAALYSFRTRDHGDRDGSDLRAYVQRIAAAQGVDLTGGRVRLLCYPRVLGYGFNPLSVYFCEDRSGRLALLLYEVRNTFGDIHSYALPVRDSERSAAGVRQIQDKQFYVSPFIDMAMRYHFRIRPPEDAVALRILETDETGPLLAATFSGHRRPLATAALLHAFARLPLVSFKIVAAIHWEALRLWIKGMRLRSRPIPLAPTHFSSGAGNDYIAAGRTASTGPIEVRETAVGG